MVRTPNNSIVLHQEETRANKRASSVGNAFRRLFSSSPVTAERSSSVTDRTPESVTSSTIPPNNPYYIPNRTGGGNGGGSNAQQSQLFAPSRATMASHRGGHMEVDDWQLGGSRRAQNNQNGETHVIEIPVALVHERPLHAPIADTRRQTDGSAAEAIERKDFRTENESNAYTAEYFGRRSVKLHRTPPPAATSTEVVVHYAVPEGQRYLPITLNETVTMIYVGRHDSQYVYEPLNDWLQSPEDGLRYHRTMNVDDVYDGCLDMATFGRPVVGHRSDDRKWLVNPLSYDPTRPTPITDNELGEIPRVMDQELSTPQNEPKPLGDYANPSATDVDLGLLAELGAAITRGAEEVLPSYPQTATDN